MGKKREVIIKDENFRIDDEWYCDWFTCPHCLDFSITQGFNYCPCCGYKIKWELDKYK